MTDENILTLIASEPQKGFEVLVDTYSALVFRVIFNLIRGRGSREDAEELSSDVFVSFYKNLDSYNPSVCPLGGYLAVCARRRAISFLRKMKGENIVISFEETGDSEDISNAYEKREEKSLIYMAIASLGEPDSTIIKRKYLLGESAKEIANTLSMKPDTVQKRAQRALEKLRRIMKGE